MRVKPFFVPSVADGRKAILPSHRMAGLLIDVLQQNRKPYRFLLHEFVVMPDPLHLLIPPAPTVSVEKAMQYIKAGFPSALKRNWSTPVPFGSRALTIIVSMAPLITNGTETISIKIRCVEA